MLLTEAGRPGEAESHWRELLLLDSRDAQAMTELAALMRGRGDLPQAIELLQRALRVEPENAAAAFAVGTAWAELGEAGRARAALTRYLTLDPADRLSVAGWLEGIEEGRLTPAYIRTLFDQYAERFDRELVGTLNYRAPALLRAAVQETGAGTGLAVLDLGCGTGLAGVALKELAERLDGVDLSPLMIEKARQRGIYHSLAVAEAVTFLNATEDAYDLIVACDVMAYLGDLAPVLAAAADRLRRQGRLAFTVELLQGEGFELGPKRRFAHSESYVRRIAMEAGFTILALDRAPLRTEARIQVAGLIAVLGR